MGKIYKYTNIVLESIQRNNRKINAIIRRSQIRRIKVYIMLVTILLTSVTPLYAIEDNRRIFCRIDPNMYVKYCGNPQPNYEYYHIKDGVELAVYCVNLGMKGAEEDIDGYLVNVNKQIIDEKLKSIVLNCYPYRTIEDLGVDSKEQAKFASQFAIWIYTAGLYPDLIEPILPEYQNVVDAIKNIYYAGISGIKEIELKCTEQMIEEIDNKLYYTRTILTEDKKFLENIEIVSDEKNIIIDKVQQGCKVYLPVESVDKEYNLELDISIYDNVVLYGTSTKEDYQDVVISQLEMMGTHVKYNLYFSNMKNKVEIIKKDKETDMPIEGVTFKIEDENYNLIGEYETDINGKIELDVLNTSKIYITEIKTLEKYVIDNNTYTMEIKPNEENQLVLYNSKKKGCIKIIKKTKEYNEITALKENMPLKDVSFYIYDENMNLISDISTNEYGIAITEKIPIGKYFIKEYKTNEHYELLNELIEVEIIEDNQIANVEILNNNVNLPKKLPVTGK